MDDTAHERIEMILLQRIAALEAKLDEHVKSDLAQFLRLQECFTDLKVQLARLETKQKVVASISGGITGLATSLAAMLAPFRHP